MLRSLASNLRARASVIASVGAQAARRRPVLLTVALILVGVILGGKVGLQLNLYSQVSGTTGTPQQRDALFELLRPVALSNCQLERFGEAHDGGYLLCANLLKEVGAGYSYGIAGYDQWGCDISTKRKVPVHQYDCFDTTRPACAGGKTVFHDECVGDMARTEGGRFFDTMQSQVAKNGDSAKRIVLKIDVEGAEWGAFLSAPDELLSRIDQIAVEFHGIDDQKSVAAVQRLKQFFEVAHIHFNNATCFDGMKPFPAWAYEVLFVSKRLAVVDRSAKASGVHPLAAPNIPFFSDCQLNATR
jgi:hypothetical protein